jgi:hypothetical protein
MGVMIGITLILIQVYHKYRSKFFREIQGTAETSNLTISCPVFRETTQILSGFSEIPSFIIITSTTQSKKSVSFTETTGCIP